MTELATQTRCYHGRSGKAKVVQATMAILEDFNINNTATSQKVKKKAMGRIQKAQKQFETCKTTLMKQVLGLCTHLILLGEFMEARELVLEAMLLQSKSENQQTVDEDWVEMIQTNSGLVEFVAARIPCKCLDRIVVHKRNAAENGSGAGQENGMSGTEGGMKL